MNDNYLIPLFVAGTSLLSLFAFFLIAYLIVQKGKQNKYQTRLLEARLQEQDITMDKISKEIHDNIGQILGLAQMNMYSMEQFVKNENEISVVKSTNELVGQAIYELHNISHSLNGDYIKRQGLSEVLRKELEHINQSGNLGCTIEIVDQSPGIDSEKAVVIYRIAQEAIHNTLKHARATKLNLELCNNAANFSLSISDNGVGFKKSPDNSLRGIGLENMYQRAELNYHRLEDRWVWFHLKVTKVPTLN
jgi:two-component system, NarL family, sensor kinase